MKNKVEKSQVRQWIEALVIAGLVAFILRSMVFGLYNVPTGSAIPTVLVGDRVMANKLVYRFGFAKVQRGDTIVFDDMNFKFDKSNKLKYWWQKYVGLAIPFIVESGPINVTKRVIAIPGDTIEGRIENGKPIIYLNSKELDEPYTNPYPLVMLKKETGLLRKTMGTKYCAYDPHKHFKSQPYFTAKPSDVIYMPGYQEATFRLPHTPTYKDPFNKIDCKDTFGPIKLPKDKYWVMGDNRKDSADSRWFGFLDGDRIQGRMNYIIFSIESDEYSFIFELIKHPIDFWTKAIRWNRIFKKPTPVTPEERQLVIPNRNMMLKNIAEEMMGKNL